MSLCGRQDFTFSLVAARTPLYDRSRSLTRSHPIWQLAEVFGAIPQHRFSEQTTHCVGENAQTDKAVYALRTGGRVKLVHREWFDMSVAYWARQPERHFMLMPGKRPVAGGGDGTRSGTRTPREGEGEGKGDGNEKGDRAGAEAGEGGGEESGSGQPQAGSGGGGAGGEGNGVESGGARRDGHDASRDAAGDTRRRDGGARVDGVSDEGNAATDGDGNENAIANANVNADVNGRAPDDNDGDGDGDDGDDFLETDAALAEMAEGMDWDGWLEGDLGDWDDGESERGR